MKYLHNGFIHGVPARDLTEDEVKKYGRKRLLDSGHYQEVRKAYTKQKISEPEAISIPQVDDKKHTEI